MTTLYQKQLNHIFNRPTTQPEWYWGDHWEEGVFDDDPLSAFTFIETLLGNIKEDLSPYSNDQIGLGLEYILHMYANLDADTRSYYQAIASVMESCLYLDNPACIESGLHGLGEMATFQADIAVPIIDAYLKAGKNHSEALVNYAKSARTGMIL